MYILKEDILIGIDPDVFKSGFALYNFKNKQIMFKHIFYIQFLFQGGNIMLSMEHPGEKTLYGDFGRANYHQER